MRFGYHPDLLNSCPELVAGVIWVDGMTNRPSSHEVDELLAAAEALTRERFPTPPEIAKHEPIGAWRQVYSRFGVKPNRYPCAAEALIRRVVETGSLPRISALVDLCIAASLRFAIPVAPFDLGNARGDWVVRLATGAERFLPINAQTPDEIPAGEVVYADDTPDVLSRRWNWRQSDRAKITLATTRLLITTEAVHSTAREAVEGVLTELSRLPSILGGAIQTDILDVDRPHSERA
jgi:DNA/RNA-binding domain of Phe-tRNA-synthetase-like protein